MTVSKMYSLPALPYDYAALAPALSEEQLRLHHSKHHQAYVNGANAVLEKLDKARKENLDLDMKATLKELAFHLGGNRMHTMLWENMAPAGKGGGGAPLGKLGEMIAAEFGSFERFKKEFAYLNSTILHSKQPQQIHEILHQCELWITDHIGLKAHDYIPSPQRSEASPPEQPTKNEFC